MPVAVLSLIATIAIGLRQIDTARRAQESERFEKLISRLASKERSERLSGISGLQLVLRGSDRERDEQTLLFLVKALAIEVDPILQNAIVEAFSDFSDHSCCVCNDGFDLTNSS